jgi:hypothetical protein
MHGILLKAKLIEDISALSEKKLKDIVDFVEYLKLKEDDWFIDFANKRSSLAIKQRKAGRKFTKLEDLKKEYR